jgi:hypothetical protein
MFSFWFELIFAIFLFLLSLWWVLTAYRVVGKPPGQDPKYDAKMAYAGGSFKVLGVIGILLEVGYIVVLLWRW